MCREPCSASGRFVSDRACWYEQDADAGTCLPPALPDELWKVSLDSVEHGPARPFMCLVVPTVTLCSEEEVGPGALFTRPFTTIFTTSQLEAAQLTLSDITEMPHDAGMPDATRFTGCEGSCSLLPVLNRTVVFSQTFDARPLASRKQQRWSIATDSGATLHLSVNP